MPNNELLQKENEKIRPEDHLENAIEIVNLNKSYNNKKILDDVTFNIKKGTIHGLAGPNGSGKTTIMCMITKLIPLEGFNRNEDIKINGKSIKKDAYTNAYIGFAPSETDIIEDYEVEDYILSYNKFRGLEKSYILKTIEESSLNKFRFHKIKDLSTGWKKLLQLFNINLSKPDILILDEPLNGLDPANRNTLFNKLINLKEEGKTILLSTHILSDLQKLADDLTIIRNGEIVFSGIVSENIEDIYERFFKSEFKGL